MKVKIFDASSWVELEKKINDFLEDFANIKNISFTNLKDNCVLCAYEGETWEVFNARMEQEFWASNRINYNYDQRIDSYT